MPSKFAVVVLGSILSLTVTQYAAASPSQCEQFYGQPREHFALWLEKDSALRTAWVAAQSGKTIQKLRQSPNYEMISNVVLAQNSKPSTVSFDSNSHASYELKFMGLGQPQSLIRTAKDGSKPIEILNTDTLKKDGSFSLLKAFASPKDSHLIVMATDNGSIDNYTVFIYDMAQKKVVRQLETSETLISWKNDKEFYFVDNIKTKDYQDDTTKLMNLETGKITKPKKKTIVIQDKETWIEIENGSAFLARLNQPRLFLPRNLFNFANSISAVSTRQVNGHTETYIHITNTESLHGKVLKHSSKNGKNHWSVIYETQKNSVVENVLFEDSYLVANTFWGPSIVSRVMDYDGKSIFDITTPECCSVNQIKYTPGNDIVHVTLSNHIKQNVTFEFSIMKNKFLDPTLAKQMLSYNGVDFTSSIHWATSQDGTKIPTRLTYRKDLPRNQSNPTLIYGYGGFNLPGYMQSFNPRMDAYVIKEHNVVIAAPALRGGNEFGPKWHESAMFENKNKTNEDFVAAAELVQSMGLTRPELTAVQGWSNGGFTSAATGLLFANKIGIVVTGNGVNDQYRKEVLDPEFGNGWAYEFGDSRKEPAKSYAKKWSPVYLAQKGLPIPNILIANGRQDTRVDSTHSFKLLLALKLYSATPEKVDMISINNSGHWMTSVNYQNLIAWKSQTLIWTYLFDKWGIQAPH
jgi:prolyl oligopeptidase